ncbi:MAG: hypothetical protein FWE38_01460 [Firmicutes bacterium]|nr:hypothetical protein [Bacillota bacterium]
MLGEIFGRGCGCQPRERKCTPRMESCDIMWIIILLMLVFNGGLFGLDLCTIVILLVVFGGQFFCRDKKEKHCC